MSVIIRARARRSPWSSRSTSVFNMAPISYLSSYILELDAQAFWPNVGTHKVDNLFGGGAGSETALNTHCFDLWDIFIREYTACCNQYIINVILFKQFYYPGEEGHVCA